MAGTPAGTTGTSRCCSSLSFFWFSLETCLLRAKQGSGASSAANNQSQSRLSCCCRHGTGLTSKRQSPPMSPLLSKQVGTSPSSRQHFRAHRPEAPAPMMATLRAAMSCGAVVAGMLAKLQPGAKHAWRGAEPGRSHWGGCAVLLGWGWPSPCFPWATEVRWGVTRCVSSRHDLQVLPASMPHLLPTPALSKGLFKFCKCLTMLTQPRGHPGHGG